MNISALLVFVFAAMCTYGRPHHHRDHNHHHHHHHFDYLQCFDCNKPCKWEKLQNVTHEYSKLLSFLDCETNKHIADKANPNWMCEQTLDMDRTPLQVYNVTCGVCEKHLGKAVPILQDFNMLFRRSCGNNSSYLEVKAVTVSLGCKCVKS